MSDNGFRRQNSQGRSSGNSKPDIPEPSFYKREGATPDTKDSSSVTSKPETNLTKQGGTSNPHNVDNNNTNVSSAVNSNFGNKNNLNSSADETDLTYQTITLDNLNCYVVAKYRCKDVDLYAIEADRNYTGCTGLCPLCDKMHIQFTYPNRSYYVSVKEIHEKIYGNQENSKRSEGAKSVNKLKTGVPKAVPLTQPVTGPNKGIEGDSNSCYMDSTIFCMFAYSDVFDSLLNKKTNDDNIKELQTLLRENIVNVLRDPSDGFVDRDTLYHLRIKLCQITGDQSFREDEKDPSEFIRTLEHLFDFTPLKTIPPNQSPNHNRSNITANIMWDMFDANITNQRSTNIASIFRNSLVEIPARLATIPPCLILVAPRHSRTERSYRYIIPDRQILVDHNMVQLVCQKCKTTNHAPNDTNNFYHCYDCQTSSSSPSSTEEFVVSRCYNCIDEKHSSDERRNAHKLRQVKNIVTLNLFAVLCIERCHYVAFVKCKESDSKYQWLFFDSMSDRVGNAKNIPSVTRVNDFEKWIKEAEKNSDFFDEIDRRRNSGHALSKMFPDDEMKKLRLFRDGAFFFYENPTANYH